MVALCEGAAELGADSRIVSIALRRNPAEQEHPPFPELYGVRTPITFVTYRLPWLQVGDETQLVPALRLAVYFGFLARPATVRSLKSGSPLVFSGRNTTVLAMLVWLRRCLYRRAVVLADVHGEPESRLARWVHRHVDGNVCISQHLADVLKNRLGLSNDQVRVAHSGVKPQRFERKESKEVLAQRLGLDRSRPIICYAGKVHYRYEEVAYLLDVGKRLAEQVTLVIVGGRPDQIPPWEEECRRQGIRNVVFTGFKRPAEVPAYLHAADLLVMYYSPSPLNDGRSPGKLFEYLASGTPLVSGRFRGIEEIVQDGENGFLVDPYRPELLAGRIRSLLQDRSRWDDVGSRGVATAQHYTWKARATAFIEYAKELSAGSPRRQEVSPAGV